MHQAHPTCGVAYVGSRPPTPANIIEGRVLARRRPGGLQEQDDLRQSFRGQLRRRVGQCCARLKCQVHPDDGGRGRDSEDRGIAGRSYRCVRDCG